jgi:hypothetical protein
MLREADDVAALPRCLHGGTDESIRSVSLTFLWCNAIVPPQEDGEDMGVQHG